ncbi:MAG: hypothetical protein B7Z81_05275 [Acidocella sp. 20-61-6]|nr:MAG: hypothetical protein B7Z81_05275 [Acidocella sp. 20-61-6]
MKHLSALPALAALLALSACGFFKANTDTTVPVAVLDCPHVEVLQQANTLTEFQPGRSDVAAALTTAQITGVAGSCQPTNDRSTVKVSFKAGFTATNGPANHSRPVTLPYFVAVTSDNRIIAKALHSITLKFGDNANTANAASPTMTIDVPNDDASGTYEVLVGFQMTQAQLDYAAAHPPSN